MTNQQSYTIRLLNKAYEIKCPEAEIDSLKRAAEYLDKQTTNNKKNFKQLDDFQALLLSALQVSHELIQCQSKQDGREKQLNEFIKHLENKINHATTNTESAINDNGNTTISES